MNTYAEQTEIELEYSKQNCDRIIQNEIDNNNPDWIKTIFTIGMSTPQFDPMEAAKALWIELLKEYKDLHIQSIGTLIGLRIGSTGLDAIKDGIEILKTCADIGIYDIYTYPNRIIIKPKIKLSSDVRNKLQRLRYMPPMIILPNDWKSNYGGGWLTEEKHVVLGKGNAHNFPQNLECLNTLQKIPWKFDQGVLMEFTAEHEYKWDKEVFSKYWGNPFYFVWRYDKRGRMYSSGYNVNLQSEEFRRAVISFQKEEMLTEAGFYWLKVAIANAFGLDKLTFDERVEWVNDQKEFDITKADKQIFAWKYLTALQQGFDGEPVNTNVFLDATASGLQIMAALSGCHKTAYAVNMIDESRHDIYEKISNEMNKQLSPKDITNRQLVKDPLMTHYYNSLANPRKTFNPKQLEAFYIAIEDAFPGAEDVMESINSIWKDSPSFKWTLPDGHVAYVRAKKSKLEKIKFLSEEFDYIYTSYEPSGNGRHLAPNIIHSIDGYITREMVRRASFTIAHVHDAFTAHPNYMGEVCKLYSEILAEISENNLLEDILKEITGNSRLKYKKVSSIPLKDSILASKHMLS